MRHPVIRLLTALSTLAALATLAAPLRADETALMPDLSGESLFMSNCAPCHQADGSGLPRQIPPLARSEFVNAGPRRAIRIVLNGLHGPIQVRGERFDNVMPPLARLSDAEVAAILTFVRQSWGNSASPVEADQVADVRSSLPPVTPVAGSCRGARCGPGGPPELGCPCRRGPARPGCGCGCN